jgi:hemoglobin
VASNGNGNSSSTGAHTDPDGDGAGDGQPTAYDLLGGEPVVRRITDRFYDLMDADPDFFAIRKLHPGDLSGSRDKLFLFLCGWLGGPQYYVEKHGHPMLRARHLPFAIGESERDQWLSCMHRAMQECGVPELLRAQLQGAFFKTADWMRNQAG